MSPRTYDSAVRRAAADLTRLRVLDAARELLATAGPETRFSIEAVAKKAGVARMTVYYQFESRAGLFEALFDHFAARGEITRLGEVFTEEDPRRALAAFIGFFVRWWESERVVFRRLRAEAVLDKELERALAMREARRRFGLKTILSRLRAAGIGRDDDNTVDALYMLTSFQAYDILAGESRGADEVTRILAAMALAAVKE